MTLPRCFETERLFVRQVLDHDADLIFQGYAQDPEVLRYLPWDLHGDIGETVRYVDLAMSLPADQGRVYSVIDKSSGVFVGTCDLYASQSTTLRIGYQLVRFHWGYGLGSELALGLATMAIGIPSICRLEATVHPDNSASRRILEKISFVCEGVMRRSIIYPLLETKPQDTCLYALIK